MRATLDPSFSRLVNTWWFPEAVRQTHRRPTRSWYGSPNCIATWEGTRTCETLSLSSFLEGGDLQTHFSYATRRCNLTKTHPIFLPCIARLQEDGTWHFCVGYRVLNSITFRDTFPIPTINEMFNELHGSSFYTKLDLCFGFHQILVLLESIEVIAFCTSDGHHEFNVMPFGLMNML